MWVTAASKREDEVASQAASGPGSVQLVSPSASARGRVEASGRDGRALLYLLGTVCIGN